MSLQLFTLLARVESNAEQFAVRFEPAHTSSPAHIAQMVNACGGPGQCSLRTAVVLCSMSFGLYQIMGDELMAMRMPYSPLEMIADSAKQDQWLTTYLTMDSLQHVTADDIGNDEAIREHFATLYNGPGNVAAYSARLLSAYQELT